MLIVQLFCLIVFMNFSGHLAAPDASGLAFSGLSKETVCWAIRTLFVTEDLKKSQFPVSFNQH
jgi:hypothetical protein